MKKLISFLLSTVIMISLATPLVGTASAVSTADTQSDLDVISWFNPDMTVADAQRLSPALTSFTRDGVTLSDTDVIATGDKIVTKYGYEYLASVKGDVYGEGGVSTFSYVAVKRYCLDTLELDEIQYASADVDKSGVVDQYDYLLIKRYYMSTYSFPKLKNASAIPVLLYHHILPDADKATDPWSSNNITIAISEFRRHLQYITDSELNVVSAEDVGRFTKGEILLPPYSICLTFDDGYKSNTYYAAPILKEFGFTATVFSILAHYNGTYEPEYDTTRLQKITVQDLAPWTDVLDQQCHTYNNHNLLSQQLTYEVYDDLMLAQAVDYNTCFAYPMGDYNANTILAVKDAGFKYAFSTVSIPAFCGADPYLIPRITITSPMKDNDFISLLSRAK